MICSWLDFEKLIGACFWEQAGFVNNEFNVILCHFKKQPINVRTLRNIFSKPKIVFKKSPNGLDAYFIEYLEVPFFSEKWNLWLYKNTIGSFNRFLKTKHIKISLVHAQSIFNAGFEAYFFKKITNTPYIFTEHNQFTFRERSKIETNLTVKVVYNARKRLVVSYDKIRQFASNWFYDQFEVIGNAVDSKVFYFDATKLDGKNKNDVFRVITTGAFVPIKDQLTILKALKKIDTICNKNVLFTWVGVNCWGNDSLLELQNLINEFNFKNVQFDLLPFLKREEVAQRLRESDLFLLSSVSEGMPISVLEALACGLPVCSTRCGGVDELINDANGKIVQIKDYGAMADFVLKVMTKEITFDNNSISIELLDKYGDVAFAKRIMGIYSKAI